MSLLSGSTPLASSDSMESFLDILASACSIALFALKIEQARASIPWDFSLDALATQTAHILLHILLVQRVDGGALVTTLEKDIVLAAKITLHVHLSFDVLEKMGRFTVELLAKDIKVDNWGFSGHKFGLGKFTTLIFGLFFLLFHFFVHNALDSVE